jgi:hypothetical protein
MGAGGAPDQGRRVRAPFASRGATREVARVRRRNGLRWTRSLFHREARMRHTTLVLASAATLAACGGSTEPAIFDGPRVDTSTLVGTWRGTLDGGSAANSFGPSAITMTLRADSTFTGEADNPLYCALNQTVWRVAGGQFTATGRDCGNTVVTFTAPAAPLRLTGTWTASSGRGGTFTVVKQSQ